LRSAVWTVWLVVCVWVNNGANVPIISLIAVQMIAFSLMGVVGGYSRVGVLYAGRELGLQLHARLVK
jgi:hypothetical protein